MTDPTLLNYLPPDLATRLAVLLDEAQLKQLAEAFATPRPTTFRANTLKSDPLELLAELTAAGFAAEPVPWHPAAFILREGTLYDLTATPAYQEGRLYVQSLSSMIPPLILDPQPGENILDLTAAPGSKTTQLAALMQNQGQIIANDLSPVRLFKLQANLRQQGVTIATTRRGPGELLWRRFPEYFDRTLVDVPCSMEGRITELDPDSYADWSYAKVRSLSIRQCHLLRAAVTATKVGGTIVYSTCTLAPEENEHVVAWLLEKEAGKVVLEDVSWSTMHTSTLPETADVSMIPWIPGRTHWQQKQFPNDLMRSQRILPTQLFEGFYVAKLRKVASTLPDMSQQRPANGAQWRSRGKSRHHYHNHQTTRRRS